jgi:hypothetical protein
VNSLKLECVSRQGYLLLVLKKYGDNLKILLYKLKEHGSLGAL